MTTINTETTAESPRRQTVPTTLEIEAALASIPMGKGEPGINTAILDVAEASRVASRAMLRIFGVVRGTDAGAPIKAAMFALSATANAFEDRARDLVSLMEEDTAQRIADGRGADYLDMRGER